MGARDPAPGPRPSASMPPFPAGVSLAGHRVRGVLGEGGTGIVYDAVRAADGAAVALKVIHPHLAGDPQIRGRFTREAAILKRLGGARVCPVLGSGEADDPRRDGASLLWLALARIDGPALDELVARDGPLPLARVVDVARDVCEALREAHAQGVIHRDLKPANVLVDPSGRAIVVDFGMAKIVAGNTSTTLLTQHNTVFGTPEYMAPEQARGDELDARCDVYAAGVLLYELLVGHVPFQGTALAILTAHMTLEAPDPRTAAPSRGIPPALAAVVQHALAKDPAARYASASALASAIEHAAAAPDDEAGVAPEGLGAAPLPRAGAPQANAGGPPSSAPPAAVRAAVARAEATARVGWRIVWLVAAAIGIAAGVWLSLRTR